MVYRNNMGAESLQEVAKKMVANKKGLLAADESLTSAAKRLAAIGVESNEETRRKYREIFLTAEGIEEYLSGVILFEETFYQRTSLGISFVELLQKKGIIPGIKVDMGAKDLANFPGEKVTEGLDGLRGRLKKYYHDGARFSKWRAVIRISDNLPTDFCITANAQALARYAALSQEGGIVPVVEPEVLIDGNHNIDKSEEVTSHVLREVFSALRAHRVDLQGLILKSSMVISGRDCQQQSTPEEVAERTLRCFTNSVPIEVPGIVFLSGGQSAVQATENLNAIQRLKPSPWEVSFSFARALQAPALKIWNGKDENIPAAQREFLKRCKLNYLANKGEYSISLEGE